MKTIKAPVAALAALAVAAHIPIVERHHLMDGLPSLESEVGVVPALRSDHVESEASTTPIVSAAIAQVRPNVFDLKTSPLAMTGRMTVAGDITFES